MSPAQIAEEIVESCWCKPDADWIELITAALASERAKLSDAVECLKFYAEGRKACEVEEDAIPDWRARDCLKRLGDV
jgi:hypothetical protein